ncbi:CPBP family intramembrane metalloprotease [Leucobacter sp. CSA2]|uniref:CPBP family intramembrane metalloprotease n=1 Tax=Leucobacter edaphi TaxID=2796472 RepID=A0A934QCK7_9MICO|nr:type II CAAX endopeptidase family protein [Leucobacter edaphi]MBK0422171.1 CPBP family intramembrane metalloprotease [Leucobacter edaphi]
MNENQLQDPRPAATSPAPARVPWGPVALYLVLAFALAWLAMLPAWLGGGLESPLFTPLLAVMQLAPTIAALVVVFFVLRPKRRARYLGLVPFRPVGRKIAVILLWPVAALALVFGAFFLSIAFGWVTPDWSLSTLRAMLPENYPPEAYVAVAFAMTPITVAIATASSFGEELGWRGFLTTALAPLGFWRSAIIIGVVWGLWHAPMILLGFNFARPNLEGLAWMCGFTLFFGVLLQWSRYWTRNVWPAAVGHGALNAITQLSLFWIPQGADSATSTIMGAPGWIVMGAAILILIATGLLGRKNLRLPDTQIVAPARVPDPAPVPAAEPPTATTPR